MGDCVPPPHPLLPSPIIRSPAFLSWFCSPGFALTQPISSSIFDASLVGSFHREQLEARRVKKIPTICSCDTDLCFLCVSGGARPGHGELGRSRGKESRALDGWMLHLLGHLDVLQHLILRDASWSNTCRSQECSLSWSSPGALLPAGIVACAGAAAWK